MKLHCVMDEYWDIYAEKFHRIYSSHVNNGYIFNEVKEYLEIIEYSEQNVIYNKGHHLVLNFDNEIKFLFSVFVGMNILESSVAYYEPMTLTTKKMCLSNMLAIDCVPKELFFEAIEMRIKK